MIIELSTCQNSHYISTVPNKTKEDFNKMMIFTRKIYAIYKHRTKFWGLSESS